MSRLDRKTFDHELERLQRELVIQQQSIREQGQRVVVIFEGRDAAGKGGVIKRINERLNTGHRPQRKKTFRPTEHPTEAEQERIPYEKPDTE